MRRALVLTIIVISTSFAQTSPPPKLHQRSVTKLAEMIDQIRGCILRVQVFSSDGHFSQYGDRIPC
jgi:hypothetical protein